MVVGLTLVLLVFTTTLVVDSGTGAGRFVEFPSSVAFVVVGAAIVSRRRRNLVGWIFVTLGLLVAVVVAGQQYADQVPGEPVFPGAPWAAWLGNWPIELFVPMLALILLLFPDGAPPSVRWRAVAWTASGIGLVAASASAMSDVNFAKNFPGIAHPLALVGAGTVRRVYEATQLIGLALLAVAVMCIGVRLRRAGGDERQQLKWVAFGAGVTAAAVLVGLPLRISPLVTYHLFVPAVPVATAVAIWKYRLYDIDVLVNRTLVYGILTAAVAAGYAGSVSIASAFVAGRARGGVPLLVAGLIAVFFGPLRQRVQLGVDRLLYGHRDDPYEVISHVGHRLETRPAPKAALHDFVETVAEVLRLPYVAIEVRDGDGFAPAAFHGSLRGLPVVVPLVHHRATVGHLVVSRRAPGEELSSADTRLLEDLARQAALVVHTLRLTGELQRSRERLVNTREEERRRLRRDLHDGLGPALAGIALQLENTKVLMRDDPMAAQELMDKLRTEVQTVLVDLRRLVYELRPPALDELGLVGAIRQQASHFCREPDPRNGSGLVISIDAPAQIDGLPAAVEVATYRIATEAIANVSRHAGASRCTVSIQVGQHLELDVIDDGKGISSGTRLGVGLASMRERAEELGGSSVIETLPTGGTRVRVRLPVAAT